MPFPEDNPRPHYYAFAHRVLPAVLFRNLEPFRVAALEGGVDGGLQRMWRNLAQDAGARQDASLPLTSTLRDCGGKSVVLITPPHPEHVTEAHYIAVVLDRQDAGFVRYVVLEHSWDFTGEARTVIAEWTPDRNHVNFGDGPPPVADQFLAVVCERFTEPRAMPRGSE